MYSYLNEMMYVIVSVCIIFGKLISNYSLMFNNLWDVNVFKYYCVSGKYDGGRYLIFIFVCMCIDIKFFLSLIDVEFVCIK